MGEREERVFKEGGSISPFKLDAVCLIKKFKMIYEKTFAETKTKEKLIWDINRNFLINGRNGMEVSM